LIDHTPQDDPHSTRLQSHSHRPPTLLPYHLQFECYSPPSPHYFLAVIARRSPLAYRLPLATSHHHIFTYRRYMFTTRRQHSFALLCPTVLTTTTRPPRRPDIITFNIVSNPHNTVNTTQQHSNTATQQHSNTTTQQHRTSLHHTAPMSNAAQVQLTPGSKD
jgi:hypothetical protein